MTTAALQPQTTTSQPALGDLIALVSGVLILIAYLILPLRSDGGATGFAFIDSGTTFPALTLIVGVSAIVAAIVNITSLREQAARWYFAGLGVVGLVFLFDNALRGKPGLALGGWLAMLGCVLMLIQVILPRPGYVAHARPSDVVFALIRVLVATLWFTQLLWKLPWNNFGCAAGALTPAAGTSGLCDWIGKEIAQPRYGLYKDFLTNVISPNLSWMAFLIVGGEAFICVSLMFGVLTRLGGLAGFLMGINLFIGLTAVANEWDWTYLMLPLLNLAFLVIGGRYFGIDGLLYQRLSTPNSSGLAKLIARFVS
ncbi:MAG: TQO small subunit DoxD [Chloroflexota bacterium]